MEKAEQRQAGRVDDGNHHEVVKLEGMLYYNADTMAKENRRQAARLKELAASWIEKKKQTEFEQLTVQGQGIFKAEEEAIMTLLTAKTSAIHKVTAKKKCNDCPSNRCADCPHFGIGDDTKALIPASSLMLPSSQPYANV